MRSSLRIGARGSDLSLAQVKLVRDKLVELGEEPAEVITIKTRGDRKQGSDAARVSDKKEWVYELELAVLEGTVDFALHSSKDVPVDIEAGTELLPVLMRENPFDAFVGRRNTETGKRLPFAELANGACVGTASLRRRAQLLHLRPDLRVVEHRGNVPTRLRKLDESPSLDGIVLACAGLIRLGIAHSEFETFSSGQLVPAINQGILVAQFRQDRAAVRDCLARLVCPQTLSCWQAERACVEVLKADCNSSVCIFARVKGNNDVELRTRVLSGDGLEVLEEIDNASVSSASVLGREVAQRLLSKGAAKLL